MRTTIHDRESHVARWRASGLNRSAYCRKARVSYPTFYGWTKSCQEASPSSEAVESGFIEVPRSAPTVAVAQTAAVLIQLACGTSLHVHHDADPSWVGAVVAAVRRC